jgi:chromosome segregation ATPase
MIVVSAAPEFLPLPPKMKMPKQAKFNVLPPDNKTSKKKPELIADISDARDKYQTTYESLAKAVHEHEREVLRERLDRAQKLAIKNHNENESNAKSLRVALKSKESFKLKHVSTKKALDDTNQKVPVLKKSNTSLQKTIKTLPSQIETLQSSKSVIDAQTHETKLQIAREKTMQMELAKASHEQRCMAFICCLVVRQRRQ